MQVFGHETVTGENHLFCDEAAACGFEPMLAILPEPAQYFTVNVQACAAPLCCGRKTACIAQGV